MVLSDCKESFNQKRRVSSGVVLPQKKTLVQRSTLKTGEKIPRSTVLTEGRRRHEHGGGRGGHKASDDARGLHRDRAVRAVDSDGAGAASPRSAGPVDRPAALSAALPAVLRAAVVKKAARFHSVVGVGKRGNEPSSCITMCTTSVVRYEGERARKTFWSVGRGGRKIDESSAPTANRRVASSRGRSDRRLIVWPPAPTSDIRSRESPAKGNGKREAKLLPSTREIRWREQMGELRYPRNDS